MAGRQRPTRRPAGSAPTGLRIVGGRWRGRKLDAGDDRSVRPTSERMREALFNILAHNPDWRRDDGPLPLGAAVLDVFAGSGALGLEALSRGAARAAFLEADGHACALIRRNLSGLGLTDREAHVQRGDALLPGPAPFAADLAFLDPPYGKALAGPALAALRRHGWLAPGALAVVETGASEPMPEAEGFTLVDERRYGIARAAFLVLEG
ncbi:16S rRNA (guanine(966)-N(2))-methyltransferase RsmD [Marinibaculum pumilum]|uniref:16S rRNA (Guanine(966)-N(2))-methyltransferase RsmD n=1 Tax=Marinibaculum pumilum TaxID=1766165 RepID=A0ABV7L2V7_9PROT